MKKHDIYPLMRKLFSIFLKILCGLLLFYQAITPDVDGFARPAYQETLQDGPIYVVQEGDSLWDIAMRFGVSLTDLERVNGISDPGQLTVGAQLVIPGLEGIQGELVTRTVQSGMNLRSLQRRYQLTQDALVRLNRVTSPAELFADSSLVLPKQKADPGTAKRITVASGQSLLELAVLQGAQPWTIVLSNTLTNTVSVVPGDVLLVEQGQATLAEDDTPYALPPEISKIVFKPLFFAQGKTAVVMVTGTVGISLTGTLAGRELHFFPDGAGRYISIQGIHALAEPGLYPLVIKGKLDGGAEMGFSQSVLVKAADYPYDPSLNVNEETIDPEVTKPEDEQWASLAAPITSQRLWKGLFRYPVPDIYKDCYPSRFGNRRSYNGSAYLFFHAGLDFCGQVGTEVYAAADGAVVFTGPLTVRGNSTLIDHGWGVYTGYLHQSEINVKVGDHVTAGQVIGLVGETGRVSGPHLHWEVWAGGIQVDPMTWLQNIYP